MTILIIAFNVKGHKNHNYTINNIFKFKTLKLQMEIPLQFIHTKMSHCIIMHTDVVV